MINSHLYNHRLTSCATRVHLVENRMFIASYRCGSGTPHYIHIVCHQMLICIPGMKRSCKGLTLGCCVDFEYFLNLHLQVCNVTGCAKWCWKQPKILSIKSSSSPSLQWRQQCLHWRFGDEALGNNQRLMGGNKSNSNSEIVIIYFPFVLTIVM